MIPIGSTIGNSIPSQQESLEEEEEIVEEGEAANSTAADTSQQVPTGLSFYYIALFCVLKLRRKSKGREYLFY